MALNLNLVATQNNIKNIVLDFISVAFIYFVPALSHLLSIPIYLAEPIRIVLILAIAHTSKRNAYLLALTLPLFSFLVSAHPNIFKGMIMTIELLLNVWLFFEISKRKANQFFAMLIAIAISKMMYYILKYLLLRFAILQTGLIATPILIQIVTSLIFSGYIYFMLNGKKSEMSQG